jgi:hypothetical protein
MRKIVSLSAALSASFLLSNDLVSAAGTSISITTNTTASSESLTGTPESLSVNANVTLTLTNSKSGILTNDVGSGTSGAIVTINNLGAIEESGTGNAIQDSNGHSTVTITNGSSSNSVASIQGDAGDGIHFSKSSNNVTLNNYGKVLSVTGGQGIDMSGMTSVPSSGGGNTTINNYAGAVIEGEANDGIQSAVGGFINNNGQITAVGSSSDGINAQTNSGLTIVNANAISGNTTGTGSITGGHHGITGGNTGTLDGTAATTPTTSAALGSYLGTGTYTMSVTNNAGGTITGNDGSGINIDGFGIQGTQIAGTSNYRLTTNESVTVTNHGTLTGYGATGDGDGIDVDGDVTVDNFGTIQSENSVGTGIEFSEGITVGGGTITNEAGGVIHGYVQPGNATGVGRGITLAGVDKAADDSAIPLESIYQNSTITNSGLIQGGNGAGTSGGESGIAVLGTTGGGYTVTINNNATGKIEGNNTGVSEDGTMVFNGQTVATGQSLNQGAIELDDTGNTYVINNSGTITQDNANGTAIEMHSSVSNTLNVTGGSASIVGNIAGDTAADSTLNISPGAGNSFTYGYNISGFTVNVNYTGTAATTGTVTLSGANTYSGTTTVAGGKLVVANTTGSATGSGKVVVNAGATIGGTGTIAPGSGNGVSLAKNSTLVSGGTQSGTTAGAGLTLDNTLAGGTILDASLGNATLAFSLGANHSVTTLTVLGNTGKEVSLASSDIFALTDLNNDPLTSFNVNTPYILIEAGTIAGLAIDNALYTGLTTTGGTDAIGNALNGYVTSPFGITLNGVNETGKLQLFLNNGELEVVPEPGTWALMLGGVGLLVVIHLRRRLRS